MIFRKVQALLEIQPIRDPEVQGFQVGLKSVIVWQARELRLHGQLEDDIKLNIKLDGRPFYGKSNLIYI